MKIVVARIGERDYRIQIVGRTKKVIMSSRAYARREVAERIVRIIRKNLGISQPFWYVSEPPVSRNGQTYVRPKVNFSKKV